MAQTPAERRWPSRRRSLNHVASAVKIAADRLCPEAVVAGQTHVTLRLLFGPRWRGGGGRDREGEPQIPALRPIHRLELFIDPQVQEALVLAERKYVADLGAESENARFESAEPPARVA